MAALKINTTIAICRLFKEVEDALQLILEGCCVQFSHHLFFFPSFQQGHYWWWVGLLSSRYLQSCKRQWQDILSGTLLYLNLWQVVIIEFLQCYPAMLAKKVVQNNSCSLHPQGEIESGNPINCQLIFARRRVFSPYTKPLAWLHTPKTVVRMTHTPSLPQLLFLKKEPNIYTQTDSLSLLINRNQTFPQFSLPLHCQTDH